MYSKKVVDKLTKIHEQSNESIEGDLDLSEAMWEIRDLAQDILREIQND